MRRIALVTGLASAAVMCAVAATPVWPTDFDRQLAARLEAIRAANSTGVSSGAVVDASVGGVGSCVFGSDDSPFDSFFNRDEASLPSRLNTNEPRGFFIYVR